MMRETLEKRKTAIFWDYDIVWTEELREGLEVHGLFCDEIDDMEELKRLFSGKEADCVCILAHCFWEDFLKKFSFEDVWQPAVVLVLEHEDTEKELRALKAGALEVLIKEKGIEIAVERILRLLKTDAGERRNVPTEREQLFEKEFLGIHFTNLEKSVLYELFMNEGQVLSRKEFVWKFWKQEENFRVVDTVVKQLRRKIEGTGYQIKGVYGKGYCLKKGPDGPVG